MIKSKTITIKAIYSRKTDTFMGIEIEMPMTTFFLADNQALWPGIRTGMFPPSSSVNSRWRKDTIIGEPQ